MALYKINDIVDLPYGEFLIKSITHGDKPRYTGWLKHNKSLSGDPQLTTISEENIKELNIQIDLFTNG